MLESICSSKGKEDMQDGTLNKLSDEIELIGSLEMSECVCFCEFKKPRILEFVERNHA